MEGVDLIRGAARQSWLEGQENRPGAKFEHPAERLRDRARSLSEHAQRRRADPPRLQSPIASGLSTATPQGLDPLRGPVRRCQRSSRPSTGRSGRLYIGWDVHARRPRPRRLQGGCVRMLDPGFREGPDDDSAILLLRSRTTPSARLLLGAYRLIGPGSLERFAGPCLTGRSWRQA